MRWIAVVMSVGLVACGGDDGTSGLVGDPAAGEAIFAANCALCHADDGSGGTGPDLRGQSDEPTVVDIVTTGAGDMVSYEGVLTEQEIADVAAYVVQSL